MLKIVGKTDVGRLRSHNEDSFQILKEERLLIVADGMGGHQHGEIASQLAVQSITEFFNGDLHLEMSAKFSTEDLSPCEKKLAYSIFYANQKVFEESKSILHSNMGTTVVAALFSEDLKKVFIAHIGDSRCYRIRDSVIQQLTRDHSLVSDAIHMAPWMTKEEIDGLPTNILTRALGMQAEVPIDLLAIDVLPGDYFLLCSDGLTGVLTDDDILKVFSHCKEFDIICDTMILQANALGGPDNITVVIGKIDDVEEVDYV